MTDIANGHEKSSFLTISFHFPTQLVVTMLTHCLDSVRHNHIPCEQPQPVNVQGGKPYLISSNQ
eukprot:m.310732 g.310732  ORF g.310732 m.310732 type:complete len:64 (+) comp16478_c0_seq38:1287-1478(+)